MQTPNFAMDTSDIDPTAPPAETRCTAHLFEPDERSYLGDQSLPLCSPLRISDNPTLWPPAILFDAVYAGAVLRHFGLQTLKDEVTKTWKNTFYPGGITSVAEAERKSTRDKRAASEKEKKDHDRARDTRHITRSGPDIFFTMLFYFLFFIYLLAAALVRPRMYVAQRRTRAVAVGTS